MTPMVCRVCAPPACSSTAPRPPRARGGRAADCLFGRFNFLFGRFNSLFGGFLSVFGRLGNSPVKLPKYQSLGAAGAVLKRREIAVFPVFSRRAGKRPRAAAGPAFVRIS
jgi:hypothetical protein